MQNITKITKKYRNWVGYKRGNITITAFDGRENNHRYWIALCSCGDNFRVRADQIKTVKSCGCMYKLDHGKAALNKVYGHYKRSAISRSYDFDLTLEQFESIITKPCYYCGSEPMQKRKTARMNGAVVYTGIDRHDNTQGYNVGNCVSCCGFCNRAKFNKPVEEFLAWIDRLVEYRRITNDTKNKELV